MDDVVPRRERIFYLVEPDSPVMNVIERAVEKQRAFQKALRAYQTEIGAKSIWTTNESRFAGAVFEDEPPAGWRRLQKYCVPDKRTKAGKVVAVRVSSLPRGVDAWGFSNMLTAALKAEYTHHASGYITWTVYEQYGKTYVLSVPLGLKCTPPGCRELKMSEYWQLREKEGAHAA
jgi:hypothetical protein